MATFNWPPVSGGGSGANTTLSNLTSPTALNQDLNFVTSNENDSGGNLSIDVNGRAMYAANGSQSVDWNGRNLLFANGNPSIDWQNATTFDAGDNPSIDWGGRQLFDLASSQTSVDWDNRELDDQGGSKAADWNNGAALFVANKLGVRNSAAATTPGSVVKKIQVFDGSGASLGFLPVYSAIT